MLEIILCVETYQLNSKNGKHKKFYRQYVYHLRTGSEMQQHPKIRSMANKQSSIYYAPTKKP